MKIFDDYFALRQQVFAYFGYVEDWVPIPLDDAREYFWRIIGGEGRGGAVRYADTEAGLDDPDYECPIYAQRFLPKWVYRGEAFTMISVDTQTDMVKLLMIFDNAKERPVR